MNKLILILTLLIFISCGKTEIRGSQSYNYDNRLEQIEALLVLQDQALDLAEQEREEILARINELILDNETLTEEIEELRDLIEELEHDGNGGANNNGNHYGQN
jgi:septation ring formation regulator EzrA